MTDKKQRKIICISGPLDIFFLVIFAALVLFQIITVLTYAPKDIIVFKNVNVATYVYENGRLVFGSPLMNVYGLLAKAFGIHPLKLIFTVLPAPILILYYLGYFRFIGLMFEDGRKVMPAMCFVALLNIWGYWCEGLTSFSLLMSWYSDAAFVLHGLLIIVGICLLKRSAKSVANEDNNSDDEVRINTSDKSGEENEICEDEDYLEEWDMKKHKIINARNLAIALGVMVILLVAVTLVLNKKINDLYAATVNLQDDLNSRCSVYEFAPDGKDVEGYLLKGSDGSITFIGGGDASNAGSLSEFIQKYGTQISNWYIYSNDEKDAGALNEISGSSSINIDNIYVLDRQDVKLP